MGPHQTKEKDIVLKQQIVEGLIAITLTHSQVPGWTHLRVQLCVVAEKWDLKGAPDFQH